MDTMSVGSSFSDIKRKALEDQRNALVEEYTAANAQLSGTLSDVDRLRIQRQIAALEDDIRKVDVELRQVAAAELTAPAPLGAPVPHRDPSVTAGNPEAPDAGVQRSLRVFLSHASEDKPKVREINRRLQSAGIDCWLDEECLLPGQDWQLEIRKAVRAADVVLVCLSNKSVNKAGYVQKELKFALDVAEKQPEGAIFLIPVKLEACTAPERLGHVQWVNLYEENGWERLLRALHKRAEDLNRQGAHKEARHPLDPSLALLQQDCSAGKLPGWEDFEWISGHKMDFADRLSPTELAFALKCSIQHGVDLVFWSIANKDNPQAIDVVLEPIKKDKGHRPLLRAGFAIEQMSDELQQSLAGRVRLDHVYDDVRRQVVQAALEHRTVDYWKNELIKDAEYGRFVRSLLVQVSDI